MPAHRVLSGLRSISANIRRRRLGLGWTQERLAEAADLETRYVQTLESGRANPTAAVLIAVADALGVSPGALFRAARLEPRLPGRPRKRGRSRRS